MIWIVIQKCLFTGTTHGFGQNFEVFSFFSLGQVNLQILNILEYYQTLYQDLFWPTKQKKNSNFLTKIMGCPFVKPNVVPSKKDV